MTITLFYVTRMIVDAQYPTCQLFSLPAGWEVRVSIHRLSAKVYFELPEQSRRSLVVCRDDSLL